MNGPMPPSLAETLDSPGIRGSTAPGCTTRPPFRYCRCGPSAVGPTASWPSPSLAGSTRRGCAPARRRPAGPACARGATAASGRHVCPGEDPPGHHGGRRATPHPSPLGLAADRIGTLEPGTPGPPAEPCTLVGSDRVAVPRTGCRSCRGGRTRCRTAGAGTPQPPPMGGPGRCGAPEPGQGPATRPTPDLGGRLRASDPLHGHHDGHLPQPSHPRLLPASMRPGQTRKGGARGRHAQTAHRPQRRDAGPGSLDNGVPVKDDPYLTRNTVAAAAGPVARAGIANKRLAAAWNKDCLCRPIGLQPKPVRMQSPWGLGMVGPRSAGDGWEATKPSGAV